MVLRPGRWHALATQFALYALGCGPLPRALPAADDPRANRLRILV